MNETAVLKREEDRSSFEGAKGPRRQRDYRGRRNSKSRYSQKKEPPLLYRASASRARLCSGEIKILCLVLPIF